MEVGIIISLVMLTLTLGGMVWRLSSKLAGMTAEIAKLAPLAQQLAEALVKIAHLETQLTVLDSRLQHIGDDGAGWTAQLEKASSGRAAIWKEVNRLRERVAVAEASCAARGGGRGGS